MQSKIIDLSITLQDMTSNKFALIKWLDAAEAGKYTVGIPLCWILDFNEDDYFKNEPDKTYIVKWKNLNGINFCKAIVVEISEYISLLQRRCTAIGGTLSARLYESLEYEEPLECKKQVESTIQRFALVKWLDVEDFGYYTAGIPLSWIIDFNEKDYLMGAADKGYLIQWQDSYGSLYINAIVVEIAEDTSTLHRRVKAIGGPLSTRIMESSIKTEPPEYTENNESGKRASTSTKDLNNSSNESASDNLDDDEIIYRPKRQKPNTTWTSTSLERPQSYEFLLKAILHNKKMIFDIHKSVIEIKEELKDLLPSKTQSGSEGEVSEIQPLIPKSDMVEIGNPGSNVYVTARQWDTAQRKVTYKSMGISLLLSVFPMKLLLESNLRGGTSKVFPKYFVSMVRRPLDAKKLTAIMDAVKKKFPDSFNEALLRIAISNKLSTLRIENANKMVNEEVASVQNDIEGSESEEDNTIYTICTD